MAPRTAAWRGRLSVALGGAAAMALVMTVPAPLADRFAALGITFAAGGAVALLGAAAHRRQPPSRR